MLVEAVLGIVIVVEALKAVWDVLCNNSAIKAAVSYNRIQQGIERDIHRRPWS